MAARGEATIRAVRAGSIAAEAGLRPGDVLASINGEAVRDEIDYRFLAAEEHLALVAARDGRVLSFAVDKLPEEDLGLDFAAATFDGVRRCRNHCLFCFVDRLPRGLRPSLYVKDDDYRYSFLFGNYVTLSNLREEDWERIVRQRLSPLHVSVHATDPALRRRLLGNPTAPDILGQLRRLAEARIAVHAQVVLVPDMNDGEQLDKTIADLAELPECVETMAVVPVGLTRFGPADGPRSFAPAEMAAIVRRVAAWQRHFRRTLGRTFVHLGDEFYLRSGAAVPGARCYDGYPQYENGVGMARVLLGEWSQVRRRLRGVATSVRRISAVCGELIGPYLRPIVAELGQSSGTAVALHVIPNHFFGPGVTVSGLLTAADVVASLKGQPLGDLLVLPRAMFDADGVRTLDDGSRGAIENALGVPVIVTGSISELAGLVLAPRQEAIA